MPKQVDGYEFSDKLISQLASMYLESYQDGKERAAHFCKAKDLELGPVCVGSECHVQNPNPCDTQERGTVHTHPETSSAPSLGDMLDILWNFLSNNRPGISLHCRIGESPDEENTEVRCEYIKPNQNWNDPDIYKGNELEIGRLYSKWLKAYEMYLEPFYQKWEKTGTMPEGKMRDMAVITDRLGSLQLLRLTKTEDFKLKE